MTSLLGSIWQSVTQNKTEEAHDERYKDEEEFTGRRNDSETTPKMTVSAPAVQVPTFSLDDHSGPSLMPPPMRAPARTQGLAAPKGPVPNRGPPQNSQQRAGSSGRGKVLLSPGHSPMDWASLTRTSNLSGVPSLQRVTAAQMKQMNGRKGKPIWSSYQGKVYNITPYLPFHPGGEKELMKSAGRDGTKLFMEIHPWVNWEGMLSACLVGILVSEEAESTLEDID